MIDVEMYEHLFCSIQKNSIMISPFVHGIIDYLYGISLICTPWVFGLDENSAETFILYITAGIVFIYSLLTKYQLSIAKIISMKTHRFVDVMVSGVLLASPWMFGFAGKNYLPHVLFGVAGFVVILLSSYEEPASVQMKTLGEGVRFTL